MKKLVGFSGRVFCLGYCIMDITISTERFPDLGETYYTSSDYFMVPGGKGLNQAICASKHGASTSLISIVSNDDFGNSLMGTIEKNNINTEYIKRSDYSSGVALINIDISGNNKIICSPGINTRMEFDYPLDNIDLGKGDILLSTLEYPLEYLENIYKRGKQNGAFIIVDPSTVYSSSDYYPLYKYIDIIKPNEIEAKNIFYDNKSNISIDDILINMKKSGIKYPLISLGEKGIVYLDDNNDIVNVSAIKVNAIDSTAAGDVFLGSLAAALSYNRYNIQEAIEYAVISSGISVTRVGASNSIPTRKEVLNYSISSIFE
ncbi:PfkB family carbohydrate kinase [Tissierella creatinophila]|uniref:Ribokinase n=1 Tax=Tissierella creatinophila DSM 6911 TaxID=1123403 RepID=A0A1U7M2F9_TISCR|nr:PfkB family carbohydrate kinase [Tissierella creatinophila]OLS01497.1 ribokinase [Tissierella creatinophila DSM 6911]